MVDGGALGGERNVMLTAFESALLESGTIARSLSSQTVSVGNLTLIDLIDTILLYLFLMMLDVDVFVERAHRALGWLCCSLCWLFLISSHFIFPLLARGFPMACLPVGDDGSFIPLPSERESPCPS